MEYSGNVRIGNWQEREVVDKLGKFDHKDRSTQILTGKRVIEHDDQIAAKDYTSTLRNTYPDPSSIPNYSARNPMGPRALAMEARLRAEVDNEFAEKERIRKEEESKRDLQSTARSAMTATGFVPKDVVDVDSRFETKNADYATETAITYYTHTLEQSKEGLNFPVTLVTDLKKPWTKVSQASEDPANGARRVRENWEHPRPLPTLSELKVLQQVRDQLLAAVPGNGLPGSRVREIFLFLLPLEAHLPTLHDGKGWVYIEDVSSGLQEKYNIDWSREQKQALLRAYDHDHCHGIKPGRMRIREFMDLIRSPMSPRKQEIVDIVFNMLDCSRTGFITVEDILSRWQGSEDLLDSLLQSLEIYNGHAANLMQSLELKEESYGSRVFSVFYKDVLTDIGDNTEQFERFIEECWRLD